MRYNRGNAYIPQATVTINSPCIISFLSDGTTNYIWNNSVPGDVQATAANGDNFNITNYGLGNQFNETTETYNGLIGEIVVYTTALNSTQRRQVEGYLAWKWGLQSTLPSSHPFKTQTP